MDRLLMLERHVVDLESQRSAAFLLGDIARVDALTARIDEVRADIATLKTSPPPG